jgi:hypothetical protein
MGLRAVNAERLFEMKQTWHTVGHQLLNAKAPRRKEEKLCVLALKNSAAAQRKTQLDFVRLSSITE